MRFMHFVLEKIEVQVDWQEVLGAYIMDKDERQHEAEQYDEEGDNKRSSKIEFCYDEVF
jgi:hypothetical protein